MGVSVIADVYKDENIEVVNNGVNVGVRLGVMEGVKEDDSTEVVKDDVP